MAIVVDQQRKIFTIHTARTTYQMKVGRFGHLLHLYYGKRLAAPGDSDDMAYLLSFEDRGFSGNPYEAGRDRTYSMDVLPQEYPCCGTGDYRSTALRVRNADGTYACDLRYKSYRILEGKYAIPQLPAVYAEDGAETLELVLEDVQSGVEVTLLYGVLADSDVITRAARIRNNGSAPVSLEKAASCCVDFLYGAYDLVHFHGRHGMERQLERSPLLHADHVLQSRRGASSHQQNPFFILAEQGTNEEFGVCYGFSLLYSGNFKAEAGMDPFGQTRAVFGMSDECFSWPLEPGEEFHTPEAALCCSTDGFAELSHQYHRLIRRHVCRGMWQMKTRPVLINSWEAAYMDFDGEKIVKIAQQSSELGVEMLVLDDGWFGKRDDDFSGLGDWIVNEAKLGCTLGELASRVNALGMRFGLWIEPEMVSEDSDLYRSHPDWAFVIPGRQPVRGRYQLVLDFSRQEVVDAVYEQIAAVISGANVEYIKVDMNRHLSDIYSHTAACQNQGVILHRYMLGVYDFLERLNRDFPQILIEGCAGGGGRFDAGMLYYTPQIWCSDDTDAIERIRIQYGTSFGYPISAVGSHVSAVPNHQTGRVADIVTRGVVAMAGTFGYELDLNLISDEEKETVRRQICDYRKYYDLIQDGRYLRLTNPFENQEFAAWEFAAEDGSEALLNVVTLSAHFNAPTLYVRLKGLDERSVYYIEETGQSYSGAALMYGGLQIPHMSGEYRAWQVHLIRK